jgi:hypothetical protein
MVQAATFGISFDDIMKAATAITLLLALIIPMGALDSKGVRQYDVLALPGALVMSFNTLWFDNFAFFREDQTGCMGTIKLIGKTNEVGYIAPANETINVTQGNGTSSYEQLDFVNRVIFGIWYMIPGTIPNNLGRTEKAALQTDNPVSALMGGIMTLLQLIFGVIYSCGLGTFRLLVGISIAVYWFLKTIPLWQLLFNMFMAFIG